MKCVSCGAEMRPTHKICVVCGTVVGSVKPPASRAESTPQLVSTSLPDPGQADETVIASAPRVSRAMTDMESTGIAQTPPALPTEPLSSTVAVAATGADVEETAVNTGVNPAAACATGHPTMVDYTAGMSDDNAAASDEPTSVITPRPVVINPTGVGDGSPLVNDIHKSVGNKKIILIGLACLVIGGVVASFAVKVLTGGGQSDMRAAALPATPPQTAEAPVVRSSAQVAPPAAASQAVQPSESAASVAQPAKANLLTKQALNDLLQLSLADDWGAINGQIGPVTLIQAEQSVIESQFNLGAADLRARNYEAAVAHLLDCLLMDPTRAATWLSVSEAFAERGKLEASAGSLKLAVYFARDQARAIEYLNNAKAEIKSKKFLEVIHQSRQKFSTIPQFAK